MYFIYDCNGKKVGNSKGYKTQTKAKTICDSFKVKGSLASYLRVLADKESPRHPIDGSYTLYTIKYES